MSFDPDQAGGPRRQLEKYGLIPPLPPHERDALRKKWKALFPSPSESDIYSNDIIEGVFKIRTTLPRFHEKLLKAFASSVDAGSPVQLDVTERLHWLFQFNPLISSTGSFENAVLQFLIHRAVQDPQFERGENALRLILRKMEGSPSPSEFQDLIGRFGYHEDQKISDQEITSTEVFQANFLERAASRWRGYQDSHKILLFNFVARASGENPKLAEKMIDLFSEARSQDQYSTEELDLALDYARRSPLTALILERVLHTLIIQDHPSKLTELTEEAWTADPLVDIPSWIAKGVHPDSLAQQINGTRYTAYLDDLPLAQKIVSVALEAKEYLQNPKKAEASRKEFYEILMGRLKRSQPLSVSQLIALFILHPTRLALRIQQALNDPNRLVIKLISASEMSQKAQTLKEMVSSQFLFIQGVNGEPDTIFLVEPTAYDLSASEGEAQAYTDWAANFSGLAHEGEHKEHAPFRVLHRHDRIASEMMAYLEEFNWDLRNITNDFNNIARGLGNTLPLFLRSLGEHNYFRRVNERLVREFFKREKEKKEKSI
jgi:hypothetical protein